MRLPNLVWRASVVAYATVVSAMPIEVWAQTPTDRAVKAREVKNRVVVNLFVEGDTKEIRYRLDDEKDGTGRKAADALLSTSGSVHVTLLNFNPFLLQATASVTEAEDPTETALAKLVSTISGIPGLIDPSLTKGAGPGAAPRIGSAPASAVCSELTAAEGALADIQEGLFGPNVSAITLSGRYRTWSDSFTARALSVGGAAAAREQSRSIGDFFDLVDAGADKAEAALKLAQDRVDDPVSPTQQQNDYNKFLAELLSGKNAEEQAAVLKAQAGDIAARRAEADASVSCAQDARNLYRLILIANPQGRLADVRKLAKALGELRDLMDKTYGDANRWHDDDEWRIAKDVQPTPGKLARVNVKASTIKVEAAEATIKTTPVESASASFDIRERTLFVPELGVGVTYAVVKRPKYGTATNANGDTIVADAGSDEGTVKPTVLINFVPVGWAGAVPIIQVGASAVDAGPALFIGPGWRVPGTGGGSGLVFGFGAVAAWVKDLQTLVPGVSKVTGTKDIEADLKIDATPRFGWYLNLQYKF